VISTLPIFAMTALKLPPKFLKEFDKIRRNFFWEIEDETKAGGKCKVQWKTVCSPLDVGGLGVLNLELFGRALRLRWLWHEWSIPLRPWVGMQTPCDAHDQELFHAATRVTLGDGARSLFWRSSWHGDKPLCTQFPRLFGRSRRKNKTVGATVNGNSWIHDLHRRFPPELLPEFLSLWHLLPDIMLRPETPDSIRWILTSNGCYSAASAYRLHFEGQVRSIAPAMIWSTWAPPKCWIFAWLLLQNRLWCADRLQRRQCPNSNFCPLCIRNLETSWHLFFECPIAKSI
jgi:hypothetical protein